MAKHRALKIGSTVPVAQMEATDAVDNQINVSGPNKILGRKTAGEGGHEELTISGLPAETTPASGDLLLIEVAGVLSKLDIANLPAGGGAVATDAIWDAKGDLAVGTGANTAAKLTVGANGLFLQAASGESTGTKWAATTKVDIYTDNDTWTKPAGAVSVYVLCIGGGGGGGSGRKGAAGTVRCGGGGGGSGGRSSTVFSAALLASTVSVTIGAGGAGGAAQANNSTSGSTGQSGNNTSFGYLIAYGGTNGSGGTAANGSSGTGGGGLSVSGSSGGAANTSGGVGNQSALPLFSSSGGGSGGGIPTANTSGNRGGNGNTVASTYLLNTSFSGNSVAGDGANGGAGAKNDETYIGQGGAGGNGNTGGNGGNGGNGGGYGAGGGGGGAAVNDVGSSGAGGNGAAGIVIVITHF